VTRNEFLTEKSDLIFALHFSLLL